MSIIIDKIDNVNDVLRYYHKITSATDSKVVIDLSETSFIRSSFVCILGLAKVIQESREKEVQIIEPRNQKVKKVLVGIGFLEGGKHSKGMIMYRNIKLDKEQEFYTQFDDYFSKKLKPHLTNVSNALFTKLMQKILELFSNAFRHSHSEYGVFCSGQFFPKGNKFSFVIVDGGVGIKKNVDAYFDKTEPKRFFKIFKRKHDISANEAIMWAMKKRNSTTGKGGLGLDLLKGFIIKSKGKMEIISDNGIYCIDDGKIEDSILEEKFNGTMIAVTLKVDDKVFYRLRSEEC